MAADPALGGVAAAHPSLRNLPLRIQYEGRGERILAEFVQPVLERSVAYDRLTGFFDVSALIAVSHGLESLWRRGGHMRLVLGIHAVPADLLEAAAEPGWPDAVIDALRKRLLAQASTLRDEFLRDRLATLAWMLKDGLLEVRVAAPRSPTIAHERGGIFHTKRYIFTDAEGNRVSAVGSPNETVPGLGSNYEELTVHMSWTGSSEYVRVHAESFERIWRGEIEDAVTRPLEAGFANELLAHLGLTITRRVPPRLEAPTLAREVLRLARLSPAFALVGLGSVALYPHQESAFVDALSRWPVRVLLADEVGLGKTLEAGAVVSYLVRHRGIRSVVVLAPKNLLKQWQEELKLHFGLDFWRYESSSRTYVSPDGAFRTVGEDGGPIGPATPQFAIISAQLARGTRGVGTIFDEASVFPELLVVDEAHAARIRPDLAGSPHPTRLWRLLHDLSSKVPHLVLLTATPLQLHWMEYHGTLSFLGLPTDWRDPRSYERSLRILASGQDRPDLEDAKWVLRWTRSVVNEMGIRSAGLTKAEKRIVETATSLPGEPGLDDRISVLKDWASAYGLLVRLHPASLLTVRNTRRALENLGYRFPKRNRHAPDLDVPEEMSSFYDQVEVYLSSAYGLVDQAAHPNRHIGLGFARSAYYQRLASSLVAAELSLTRRLERIEALSKRVTVQPDDAEEDADFDEDAQLPTTTADDLDALDEAQRAHLEEVLAVEGSFLKGLISTLKRLPGEHVGSDPKLQAMLEVLDTHLKEDKILVFSRYTDTIEACVKAFFRHFSQGAIPGHAVYTGQETWIDAGDGPVPATKEGVKDALTDGLVSVVFCSDAAAEGLNLQAARVVVNVDVPWNPARLEQRIGRIDRMGQRAHEVDVYFLWYPDSVEAKMYSRLLERRELYELAVGEAAELVSDEIRDQVAAKFESRSVPRTQALTQLQDLRQQMQYVAVQKVWRTDVERDPPTTAWRRAMIELVSRVAERAGYQVSQDVDGTMRIGDKTGTAYEASSVPGLSTSMNLSHPALSLLESSAPPETGAGGRLADLCVIEQGGTPYGFCVRADGRVRSLRPEDLPRLMTSIIEGSPLSLAGTTELTLESSRAAWDSDLGECIRRTSRWLPDTSELRTLWPPDMDRSGLFPRPDVGEWAIRDLGPVPVEGPSS